MKKDDNNMTDEMLEDILAMKLNEFADLETGSEEALNAAKAIRELMEGGAKRAEVKCQKKNTKRQWLTGLVLGLLGISVPAGMLTYGLKAGYEFEAEDGIVTSPTFKMFLQNPLKYFIMFRK